MSPKRESIWAGERALARLSTCFQPAFNLPSTARRVSIAAAAAVKSRRSTSRAATSVYERVSSRANVAVSLVKDTRLRVWVCILSHIAVCLCVCESAMRLPVWDLCISTCATKVIFWFFFYGAFFIRSDIRIIHTNTKFEKVSGRYRTQWYMQSSSDEATNPANSENELDNLFGKHQRIWRIGQVYQSNFNERQEVPQPPKQPLDTKVSRTSKGKEYQYSLYGLVAITVL